MRRWRPVVKTRFTWMNVSPGPWPAALCGRARGP